MAKDKGPTASQKNYLTERLTCLFSLAEATLRDRAAVRRMEVERKVREKAGLATAENAAYKLQDEAFELNRQYIEITGRGIIQIGVQPLSSSAPIGGILARKIEEELGETKEGQIIAQLASYRSSLMDRIHLSNDSTLDLNAILTEAQLKIDEFTSVKKLLKS